MGFLIDSNVLIDYVAERFDNDQLKQLDAIFDDSFHISIITKIETLGFKAEGNEEQRMTTFLDLGTIIKLDDDIVQQTIDLKKIIKIKTPVAIIAATALVKGLVLITRNTDDFNRIPRLKVENPHLF